MRVYEGEPVGLIEDWAGADAVIVVDAVSSGAPPGTIHRLDPLSDRSRRAVAGLHARLRPRRDDRARPRARAAPHAHVYGIEGERFAAGTS